MRVVRTATGARLLEGDAILSEVLDRPGPTHCLGDLLAACVAALAPGPRCALLGFAGGGIVAPLRAMGYGHALEAVDLSREGEALFRELAAGWAGEVRLARNEAGAWLRGRPGSYHAIVEDLTVTGVAGTTKPEASFGELPAMVRDALLPGGVAATNLLPHPGRTWPELLRAVAAPFPRAVCIEVRGYFNRVVVAGDALPPAREVAGAVRARLAALGSTMQRRLAFRTQRA
ncbi:MAG: hypothetical protein ACT4PV_05600 [Planctomycetaceae bacterium]